MHKVYVLFSQLVHLGHPDNLQQFSINIVIKYWQVQEDTKVKLLYIL